MTIAEQWRLEGEAKGRAGGAANARITLLTKVLTLKFGHIDAPYAARLHGASPDLLDLWVERVLTSANLADVFSD